MEEGGVAGSGGEASLRGGLYKHRGSEADLGM